MSTETVPTPQTNARGQRICGAQLRGKPGRYCQATMIIGTTGRCRLHGGASPHGVAHPRFVTGRYSKDLPVGLTARFKGALADTDMLNLSREVALIDARLGSLLAKLESGDGRGVLVAAREMILQFKVASTERRMDDAAAALNALEDILARGATEYAQWSEVRELVDDRRKLVESERKRLVELRQMLSLEQALAMIGHIEGIIRARVTDPKVLAAIASDLGRVVTGPSERIIDGVERSSPQLQAVPVAGGTTGGPVAGDVIDG